MHKLSAGRRGSLAAAALIIFLLTGATTIVGISQDVPPTRLIGAKSAQDAAPLLRSAVRVSEPAAKTAAHLAQTSLPPPRREPALTEWGDNDEVDEIAVDVLSEEDAVLALERELSLKVGKQMRDEDYPAEAQRWRWTGTVMIDVVVGANGSVKDVSLGKTSGFRILDAQALTVVRRVSKLFVPAQLRGRDVAVTIPIGFYMQDM